MRQLLLFALSWLALAADPPKQPIAFSHKQHAGDFKLPCLGCHANPPPGEAMTFPAEAKCMACHLSVKTDSAEIVRLAKFAADKKRIPWVRVYQVPSYVFWSHKSHINAGAKCSDCHGNVAALALMSKEKETSMGSCMECHRQNKVSNDCSFCHDKAN